VGLILLEHTQVVAQSAEVDLIKRVTQFAHQLVSVLLYRAPKYIAVIIWIVVGSIKLSKDPIDLAVDVCGRTAKLIIVIVSAGQGQRS